MANIVIKHNEINDSLEKIVDELKKIDSNIINLNDNLSTIGKTWQCENGNYLQEISLNKLATLKNQEENIKILMNKIIRKLDSYNELEQRILENFGVSE